MCFTIETFFPHPTVAGEDVFVGGFRTYTFPLRIH